MTDREKFDIAAKVWNEMYRSNFFGRSQEKQREFADGLVRGLKKAGVLNDD